MPDSSEDVSTSTDIPIWELSFDILFYCEGDAIIAHCLQTDTAVQADKVPAAKEAIRTALEAELDMAMEDGDLADVVRTKAPNEVWERVSEAVAVVFAQIQINAKALPEEHRRFRSVFYFLEGVAEAA